MRRLLIGLALLFGTAWMILAGVQSGSIPLTPTAAEELPASIQGKGLPARGTALAYYEDDPKARGYLAVPEGGGKHGAIVLIHEWNGLVDRIRQVADSLAAEGYVVLAADLYSGRTGANPQENMALVQETMGKPEMLIANLNAAVSYLRGRSDVSGKVAAIGWCYGGGVALSFALGGEAHEATAIFYGRLLDDPEKLKNLHHEIYGTFAGLDQGPSPEDVDKFSTALRTAGIPNDIHIYDEVNHGFWLWVERDPDKATEPALDAWKRLKAYLGRTIG